MAKSIGLFAGIVSCLALAAGFAGGARPGLSPASPKPVVAEQEPGGKATGRTMVWEGTRSHALELPSDGKVPFKLEFYGGRYVRAGSEEYFVAIQVRTLNFFEAERYWVTCRLRADDAAALLAFHGQTKNAKRSASKDVVWSGASWWCSPYAPPGHRYSSVQADHWQVEVPFEGDYRFVVWWRADRSWHLTIKLQESFFTTLAETLKDLEKLKKVKPSLELK